MQILFQFDVRTVALFVGMSFFVQATVIGAQAFLIRELKQYRGVGAALLANLCVVVGLMMHLFANRLPVLLITVIANTLLLTGLGLFYIALSQFTDLPYSPMFVPGVIAIVACLLFYFTHWEDALGKRMLVLALGSIVLDAILIFQLWRTQKTSLRFSANLMLVSFLVHEIFLIVRTISIALVPPQDSSGLTRVQSATYLFSFAVSFFWSMGFILMVSQRLKNDLMEMATIDVLTRLPNRRATQAFLEKELSRAQRSQGEFTVLLIDIDDFKQINDRWGHAMGDEVLTQTASIFHSMIRKQDLVGRWGGEEFLIIVPGLCDSKALAERVRCEIADTKFGRGTGSFGITVSIGVACANSSDQIDQILRNADQALYQSKRKKNMVSIAERISVNQANQR
jgi:diguanylate cyclase (GGDEF)-like protein